MRLMTILLTLQIACGDKSTDTAVMTDTATEPSAETTEPDLANGQSIHDTKCQACHASNAAMANTTPVLSDDELADVIQNGKGSMPAQSVSGSDLTDLIAFLRQEYP